MCRSASSEAPCWQGNRHDSDASAGFAGLLYRAFKPEISVSTQKAYSLADKHLLWESPETDDAVEAVCNGDIEEVANCIYNKFEKVLNLPEVASIKRMMLEASALNAGMSGSGPTVFGIFKDKGMAEGCARSLEEYCDQVFVCRPVSKGLRLWISACIKMEKTVHTQTEMFERTVFFDEIFEEALVLEKKHICQCWKITASGPASQLLLTMTGFSGQCEAIENQVFRFHVLANSDSQEDQALKLKVRDRVLEYSRDYFRMLRPGRGRALAAAHLQELCQAAQDEVYRQGYDYPVKAEIVQYVFRYPGIRNRDAARLYCYDALRITIGEAEGHNWWCVMFPDVPYGGESQELNDVLSESQMEVVENRR